MTTATAGVLRVLSPRDLGAVTELLAVDPITNCFVSSRVKGSGLDPWRLGGELWGWSQDGELVSLLYLGANLVPVSTTAQARTAFAERLRRLGRRCSSIVGPSQDVAELWPLIEQSWGPVREIRSSQPLLFMDSDSQIAADYAVRQVHESELDILVPACVAMFTEEVGISPTSGGGGDAYRARILDLIRMGRAYARIENGRVLFKAEIGAIGDGVCQVQGVWVAPEFRGQGFGAPGMASVVALARRQAAPVVSLYVNDYNLAARRLYSRVGFRDAGTLTTILF
jgi:predicted GNAT family acetyltransferase